MKFSFKQTLPHFFFFALLVLLSACNNEEQRAKPLPTGVNSYVYAYTSGVISKAASVRIRFAKSPVSDEQMSEPVDANLLSFSPAIEGEALWEDAQTLLFEPASPMKSNTAYIAKLNLKKLFPEVPKDAQSFEFDFHTKEQFLNLEIDGLSPENGNDLSKQQLKGSIYTSDVATVEEVETVLAVNQKGSALNLEWEHGANQLQHRFVVGGIARSEKESEVELSVNGKTMNTDQKLEQKVTVPAIGDFKVTAAEVKQDAQQYVLLHFSDPLLQSQSLDGLIRFEPFDGNLRFTIDENKILVYPSGRVAGQQKIIVEKGVRNINSSRIKNPNEWTVSFTDIKPQVRLAGTGVIMPNSEGLIFPFEAVSLKAVEVEVFKIYDNNILQFLQTNELNGSYDLARVGKIIMQKKISLQALNPGANTKEWTRYALDLGTLIEDDPHAIYQVRIGFRPAYAIYYCGGSNESEDENLTLMEDPMQEGDEFTSIFDGWYGIDGYYEGYRWQHREDPCFPGYYNQNNFASRNIIASNIGIISKGGNSNSLFVAVTDLRTTAPISNAALEFYDFQQQLIATQHTDSDGIARVELDRTPFVVIAKQGEERGYLKLQDRNALSLSKFDVAGAKTQKGLKGFLYGERGVWRPGDSVYLHFVLDDRSNSLPANYPLTFELYDPRGQMQLRRTTSENINNVYPLHFATNTDSPTGNWRADVKVGGASFGKTLKIETVKPNRLKVKLDFGKEELSVVDEPVTGNLQVNWLHGAPARNLDARVEVQVRSVNTAFDKYSSFEFDDPARSLDMEPQVIFEGPVNDNGYASFNASLINNRLVPGKLSANFRTRAFEKSGEFSADNFSLPYYPYSTYTGIAIPKNKYGSKKVDMGEDTNIDFVVVDKNGNPLSNRNLKIGMYRVQWRWWWERSRDNISKYNSSSHYDAEESTNTTTNSKGEAAWTINVPTWGRYLIRVCDAESGHCSGDFFYAGSPWYDDDSPNREAASMLAFSSDKSNYSVGETAELQIPTGEEGRALITLENGTKVLESYWMDAEAGDNTFRFYTTEEMAPTVYAHVSLVQPHAQVKNDLPIRMYGVIPINVTDPKTKITPTLKMPDELKPEETVTLEIAEKNGQPMAYTIAMVDEGLLDLTRFKTPNPWDAFYAREALGVKTWDVYDYVLGAYGGELERILSIGGDGELEPGEGDKKANRFKPVVNHLGPFYLNKGKKAKHKINIPNYVGSVRTMVIAADRGAYGSAEKTTPVRKPLMVLGTLPRVLGPSEQLQLPVTVFAMDNKVKDVTVTLEESSRLVNITDGNTRSVRFARTGDEMVYFDVRVAEQTGIAKFKITAKGGGETATQEIEIDVRNPNPYVTNVKEKILDAGESWSTSFEPVGMYGTNEGVLEVSNIPPIDLGKRLQWLLQYPHGCVEQTTSTGFPQLFVNNLLDLSEQQKTQSQKNIAATIERLKQFQTTQGGFGYWPGSQNVDDWASSYAGHFLLEAQKKGYSVPSQMLSKWKKHQKKVSRSWNAAQTYFKYFGRDNFILNQAYRLYTLALAESPDLASMNRLREEKNLPDVAKWRLAAAYAVSGKPEVATGLIEDAKTNIAPYQELAYTYGSGLRDQAMILETLVLLGEKKRAASVTKDIAQQLSANRWWSTQTVAYSLMAISKFVGDNDANTTLAFTYKLGNSNDIDAGSSTPIMQVAVPVDDNSDKNLTVNNTSQGMLFTRLILSGQPIIGEETDENNDLNIQVVYKTTDGSTIDPSSIERGTDFVAEVRISHPNTRSVPYKEMALTQIFPSGWEILNTRMDNISYLKKHNIPEYQDVRDDRVYTYFDIDRSASHTYLVQLNAAYEGRFYLPATNCEAMYDNTINARRQGQWVEVMAPSEL